MENLNFVKSATNNQKQPNTINLQGISQKLQKNKKQRKKNTKKTKKKIN